MRLETRVLLCSIYIELRVPEFYIKEVKCSLLLPILN